MTDKPLDLTKPVRTRDGRKVRIICTDAPGQYSIVGLIDGVLEAASVWPDQGMFYPKVAVHDLDLVNIEPEPVTM